MGSVPSSATYFRLNVAKLLTSLNLHLIYEVGDNTGACLSVLLGRFNAVCVKGLSYILSTNKKQQSFLEELIFLLPWSYI